jgi:hypothetical protein
MMVGQTVTYKIPTDFATLQAAIDALSPTVSNDSIELLIESGFQPSAGILVQNGDFSNFKVTSEDATVFVSGSYNTDFIRAVNAQAPVLGCLVDAQGLGNDGYAIENESSGFVDSDCGVINAGQRGLYVTGNSKVFARRCVFNGAANRGLWVTRNSFADVELGKFNGCNSSLAVATSNSVRRCSHVNAAEAEFNNNFQNGINATRASTLNLAGASVSNNQGEGVRSERGSLVSLAGQGFTRINDNTSNGVRTFLGGIVAATGDDIEVKDNGTDFVADTGIIFATGAITTGDVPARAVYSSIERDIVLQKGDDTNGAQWNYITNEYTLWGTFVVDLTTSDVQTFTKPQSLNLTTATVRSITFHFEGSPTIDDRNAMQSSIILNQTGSDWTFACDGTGTSAARTVRVFFAGQQNLASQFT